MMLLAPKTRCAVVNLRGSLGGKYGASMQVSAHLRRSILQAAQGLSTTTGGRLKEINVGITGRVRGDEVGEVLELEG